MIFNFKSKTVGFGSPETSMEVEVDQIEDVLHHFTRFLKGCGYDVDEIIKVTKYEPEQYTFTVESSKEDNVQW
jgi:enamine deaminase RidA (YjgF/YER057c/UK114 family)